MDPILYIFHEAGNDAEFMIIIAVPYADDSISQHSTMSSSSYIHNQVSFNSEIHGSVFNIYYEIIVIQSCLQVSTLIILLFLFSHEQSITFSTDVLNHSRSSMSVGFSLLQNLVNVDIFFR